MENNRFNQRNAKGQRHGEWVRLWGNNNIKWHSFFINETRYGHSLIYDPSGNLMAKHYYAR